MPLTTIPEHDIEQGFESETECICNWNECSYTSPCFRHFMGGYVICSVVFCGGLILTIFLAFLHMLHVF